MLLVYEETWLAGCRFSKTEFGSPKRAKRASFCSRVQHGYAMNCRGSTVWRSRRPGHQKPGRCLRWPSFLTPDLINFSQFLPEVRARPRLSGQAASIRPRSTPLVSSERPAKHFRLRFQLCFGITFYHKLQWAASCGLLTGNLESGLARQVENARKKTALVSCASRMTTQQVIFSFIVFCASIVSRWFHTALQIAVDNTFARLCLRVFHVLQIRFLLTLLVSDQKSALIWGTKTILWCCFAEIQTRGHPNGKSKCRKSLLPKVRGVPMWLEHRRISHFRIHENLCLLRGFYEVPNRQA